MCLSSLYWTFKVWRCMSGMCCFSLLVDWIAARHAGPDSLIWPAMMKTWKSPSTERRE
ncbi:hypothetical protein VFPPC_15070 [Pochonia chlamydosporia 170]|uniref:Uncharacterized protein n=1 Tax=Pochonia chlamydosporia 170 TaxID=1380566 RepID=A0A179G3V9_METCM|nr:hypothetical protein VFPPC_15070 [Pochonia chlamydosporia 170]OAQ72138.1 hypothetical protein VFPPC_15070 [Pochonia chlamydosporia 170]